MIQTVILFCIVATVAPLPVDWNVMNGRTLAVSPPGNNSNYILNYSTNDQSHYQIGTPGKAVEGAYSYTDKHGRIHRVDYQADHKGFRAISSTTEPKLAVAKRIRCVPIIKSKSLDSDDKPDVSPTIAVLEKNDTTNDNNISAQSIIQIQEDLNGEEVIGEVRKRQTIPVKSTYQQQVTINELTVSYPCPSYPFLCLVPFSVPIMLG